MYHMTQVCGGSQSHFSAPFTKECDKYLNEKLPFVQVHWKAVDIEQTYLEVYMETVDLLALFSECHGAELRWQQKQKAA